MMLHPSIETAVMEVYLAYWESYITGDVDKLASFLDDNYTQVGSAESEVFFNKQDAVQFVQSTIHQVAGKVDMRNRNIRLEQWDELILINEQTDLYFEQDGTWAFYAKFRASSLVQQKDGAWKIIHQHSSMPDLQTQEGENIAIEKITKENLELRDAIKRRTIELEYKNRELEMETSLERVRTVAMGMRNGTDLMDICEVLFAELGKSGFDGLRNAMINIYDDANEVFLNYDFSPGTGKTVTPFAYNIHPVIQRQVSQLRSSKDAVSEIVISGNELTEFRTMRVSNGEPDDPRFDTITAINYYFYSTGVGAIGISSFNTISGENRNVLQRFRNVFDLAYQRYMDISHAEDQARESFVQLALERVRARTMAMQQSEELPDAANTLFLQVQALGIPAWSAGYCIWDADKKSAAASMSSEGVIQKPFNIPTSGDPSFVNFYEAYRRGDAFYVEEIGGEALVSHYQFMRTLPVVGEVLDGIINAGFPLPTFQIFHVVFFSQGYLLFITYERMPEAHEIFKKFTQVFEQTYTRFLDLQKAEAQAREAQIEAALERVRSRSMGMQKSDELKEVIQVVFEQFVQLNIHVEHAGFVMDYKAKDDYEIWVADPLGVPAQLTIPYFDAVYYNRFNEAKEKGADFFATNLSYEEKNTFYQKLFEYIPGLAEESKKFYFSCPGLAISTVLLDNIGLYIENFSGNPFSNEENAALMRFGKVFQQTYTRFLDLQRAEAQALEVIKRTSIDRVRAEIASMRTTGDLDRITPLIWNELTTLALPFTRCGVFIMDEEQQQVHTYLSNPEGESMAAFHQSYNTPGEISEIVRSWRKGEMYVQHWDEARFNEFTKNLVQQGAITTGEKYLTEIRTTDLHLHFLPFLQGMLYVGNSAALSDNELKLVQNLADAFSTAYARYEDFNKLDAAKQQVDRTLADLKQAQSQLVQAEKMASLGELTAGIAHEIQNPLNFVNNFSELNAELIGEMDQEISVGNLDAIKSLANDIRENEQKINHHGKRADAIVKGMLQHSQNRPGIHAPTDINALADEFIKLAYHGLRAKDKLFNVALQTDFDNSIGKINIVPQDIGRVLLNLYNNAFYAVHAKALAATHNVTEKKHPAGAAYEPVVSIRTIRNKGYLEIIVQDNGNGIPETVAGKIFQPFFTTKPTGEGTGLGLSLAYDIIKAHNGSISMKSIEGEYTTFTIALPAN